VAPQHWTQAPSAPARPRGLPAARGDGKCARHGARRIAHDVLVGPCRQRRACEQLALKALERVVEGDGGGGGPPASSRAEAAPSDAQTRQPDRAGMLVG